MLRLRSLITGYLIVAVQGRNTEKFINLANSQHIPLWDVQRAAEGAYFKVELDHFFALRHLAKRTHCRLQIVRKAGLPFFCHRFTRRRGLLLGCSLFIVALYLLSSFIWFVEVQGNENLEADYIRHLATQAGAAPGLFKESLDKNAVISQMLLAEPRLEWVGLHLQGTKLVIEIVEEIKSPPLSAAHAHLVAAKDGLVTDVLVIVGEAKVEVGETVKRGQLLIEGYLSPEPQYAPEAEQEIVRLPVRARGEVTARVWYEGYTEAELTETTRRRTGSQISCWNFFVDGQSILRVGRDIPYRHYDTETSSRRLLERILSIPVEIVTETYYEVVLAEKQLTRAEAVKVAAERAKKLAELQLPPGETAEQVTVREVELNKEGFVGVQYILETRENIAVEEIVNGGEETF